MKRVKVVTVSGREYTGSHITVGFGDGYITLVKEHAAGDPCSTRFPKSQIEAIITEDIRPVVVEEEDKASEEEEPKT